MGYVGMGTVTGGKLYCRKKAQAGYEAWGRFDDNASIKIYSCSTSGWYETRWPVNGTDVGYVMSQFVTMDSGGSTIPGVSGSGPNSKISAADIRNNGKCWLKDLNTTHPQIKILQGYLNSACYEFAHDIGWITCDGVYGNDTEYMVKAFQGLPTNTLGVDGKVGPLTLAVLESGRTPIS